MPHRNPPDPGGPLRRITSTSLIIAFALVMTASVLGVMAWKALEAKATALASGSAEIQNAIVASALTLHKHSNRFAADTAASTEKELRAHPS